MNRKWRRSMMRVAMRSSTARSRDAHTRPRGATQIIDIATLDPLGTTDDMSDADDAAALAIYIEALKEGVTVPPIAICQVGEKRFLIDGRHRLRAHQQLGLTTIAVQVFPLMLTPSIALIMAFGDTAEFRRRWLLRKAQGKP